MYADRVINVYILRKNTSYFYIVVLEILHLLSILLAIEEILSIVLEVGTLAEVASVDIAQFDWHLSVIGADSQAVAHVRPIVQTPIG
jgi:hypothetical protein